MAPESREIARSATKLQWLAIHIPPEEHRFESESRKLPLQAEKRRESMKLQSQAEKAPRVEEAAPEAIARSEAEKRHESGKHPSQAEKRREWERRQRP